MARFAIKKILKWLFISLSLVFLLILILVWLYLQPRHLAANYYYESTDSSHRWIGQDEFMVICPTVMGIQVSDDKKYIAVKQVPYILYKDRCPDQFENSKNLIVPTARYHRPICNIYVIDVDKEIVYGPLTAKVFQTHTHKFSSRNLAAFNDVSKKEGNLLKHFCDET